ncbi:MAG TPA: hypothetical protein VH112_08390 [Acidimicrobiales bacterium]|jgi:hypothetical protein|nr:hypothetical protein [Acidimicrobiales bacterium]
MRGSLDIGVLARRSSVARATAVTAVALSLGLTAVACGGGSSSSSGSSSSTTKASLTASQWANHVCGAITSWVGQLQSSSNSATSGLNGSDLQQVKTQFVNFLGGAVASTNTMISGVQAAGAPSVPNGRAISQGLVSGLQGIQSAFVQAQTQAQALPADNPTALSSGAQGLATALENAGNQVRTSLNSLDQKYPSSELDAALKNQAACQSLNK